MPSSLSYSIVILFFSFSSPAVAAAETGTSHSSFSDKSATSVTRPPGAVVVCDPADPFGAAPFDPEKIRKHLKKQESQKKRQQLLQQSSSSSSQTQNNESNQEKKVTAIRIDAAQPPAASAAHTAGNADHYHTYL